MKRLQSATHYGTYSHIDRCIESHKHSHNIAPSNESIFHINDQLVHALNREITLYKRRPKYTQPLYNSLTKHSVFPKKPINNINNKFTFNNLNKYTSRYKVNALPSLNMKRLPFIIKCMDKTKRMSLYDQPIVDPVYSHKYRKASVNIEDILLNHNMNERCGMTSKKVNGCCYFRGVFFRDIKEQEDKGNSCDNKKEKNNEFFITYNVYNNGNTSNNNPHSTSHNLSNKNYNEYATSSKGFTSDCHSTNIELVLDKRNN